jgi:hypothetical protein
LVPEKLPVFTDRVIPDSLSEYLVSKFSCINQAIVWAHGFKETASEI